MTFGIEGQYKMSVSIGNKEDFLTEDKFTSFILIENIGLSLPYFELCFDCVYPELLRYFNEKQAITVQLGTSTKDLQPIELVIKKPIVVPKSADCSAVTLRGFVNMLAYLENENKAMYEQISSVQLAQQIAGKYGLKFKSNLESTNDLMTYYQPSFTDYKFLYTEWLHSNPGENDIIIPAITCDSTMTYNSLSTLISEFDTEKGTTFTDIAPENGEIKVNANCTTESNTTLSNSLGNYMKQRDVFDIDTGILEHIDVSNNTPIISESKTTSVDESISKSSGFFVQSSNVHKTYYKQELVNRQKFFSIQASKQWVSAPDTLIQKVHAGDLAMYMTKKENNQVNDQVSGLYLISKKVISIKDRKVFTNCLLCRENMNYSK